MSLSATYRNSVAVTRDDPTESPLYEPDNQVAADGTGAGYSFAAGDISLAGNLTYWEVRYNRSAAEHVWFGIADVASHAYTSTNSSVLPGSNTVSWAVMVLESAYAVQKRHNNTTLGTILSALSDGDIVQFALDEPNGDMWIGRNDTWDGTPSTLTDPTFTGISGTDLRPALAGVEDSALDTDVWLTLKSYTDNQTYSAPAGFSAFTGPITVSPAMGAVAFTGYSPALSFSQATVSPGAGALALTGHAPVAALTTSIVSPGAGSAALTGYAPAATVTDYIEKTPAAGALAITGNAPTPTVEFAPITVSPGAGALAITGTVSTVFDTASYAGDMVMEGVTGEGAAQLGNTFAGDIDLAPIELEVFFGYQGDSALGAVVAEGTLGVAALYSADITLAALRAEGAIQLTQDFAGDALLPVMQVEGTVLSGLAFAGDLPLAPVSAEGTLFTESSFSADMTLAAAEGEATLLTGVLFQGANLELPALQVDGTYVDATVLTYWGMSTNTFNLGHGGYVNTNYDGLGRLGTKLYAAMADGLYRLDGEDDAGTPIEAYFLGGYEDFGVEAVKSQRVAYIGASSDGALELLVRTDKRGDDLFEYPVENVSEEAQEGAPLRVKLGRGLKGRYWQTGVRNCDGAYFNIDRIGLGVWTSTRKR